MSSTLSVYSTPMVRRLPVIQTKSGEDEAAAQRPRWQWALIGAGLAITIWLPLTAVALPFGARLASHLFAMKPGTTVADVAMRPAAERVGIAAVGAGPVLVAFAMSCACAGAIVGRFGSGPALRLGALAGFSAAAIVWCFAAVMGALGAWPVALFSLVLLALTGPTGGALGSKFGARGRH
jgi:hypothetical protein